MKNFDNDGAVAASLAKLVPAAERFDCIEYGHAMDETGTIGGFDELVTPAEPITIGDPVAVVLTRVRGCSGRVWYAVRVWPPHH